MATYVEAPNGRPKTKITCPTPNTVFLAGGISKCGHWQPVLALGLGCEANKLHFEHGENKLLNQQWNFLNDTINYRNDKSDKMKEQRIEHNPNLIVFNPRRNDFDLNNKDMTREQIAWEYRQINACQAISFWFTSDTIQPITLFELGKCLMMKEKKLFVGFDPSYERAEDIEVQVGLANPTLPLYTSLIELQNAINRWAEYESQRFRWDGK